MLEKKHNTAATKTLKIIKFSIKNSKTVQNIKRLVYFLNTSRDGILKRKIFGS